MGKQHGVKIYRLDFFDPQGGKGACDWKAATIKAHMQLYLNSGHDIETPAQMCEAMLYGIPSLSVTLCKSVSIPAMRGKIPKLLPLTIAMAKDVA